MPIIILYCDNIIASWLPIGAGYAQYIRFLYFETTVNNPVMHTFVYLLSDRAPPTERQDTGKHEQQSYRWNWSL